MEKIKINLLPIEFTKLQVEQLKFKKVQLGGAVVILALVFLSISVIGLRFLQSKDISKLQNQLKQTEDEVKGLQNHEVSLTVLKDRLNIITALTTLPSKQRSIYSLISSITPPSISVNSMTVDKNANVILSIVSPDSTSFADYLQNLTSSDKNEDQILQVVVDSISRNKDGSFRVSLKVRPK